MKTYLITPLKQIYFFLQNLRSVPESPVTAIEQAITQSHSVLRHFFDVSNVCKQNGRHIFKGKSSIWVYNRTYMSGFS